MTIFDPVDKSTRQGFCIKFSYELLKFRLHLAAVILSSMADHRRSDINKIFAEETFHLIAADEMKRFFCKDFIDITSSVIRHAAENNGCQMEPEFQQFVAEFYTEALAGTLVNWVKNRHEKDREKTIGYLTTIIEKAISNLK